jgi:hypothetical protein
MLVAAAGVVTYLRRRLGGGLRRNLIMLAGTIGGFTTGVLVASAMPRRLGVHTPDVCAILGVVFGWAMSVPIALRAPARDGE